MTSKLFLDTNALLDIAIPVRPQHAEAVNMLEVGERGDMDFYASVGSLKDAYFIMRRTYVRDESLCRKIVREMSLDFVMVDLTSEIAERAFASDEPDFEDGIIRASAEAAGCDAIVSRDAEAFASCGIPRLEARDLVV